MLKKLSIPVALIRVPVSRRRALNLDRVKDLAQNILANGQSTPIQIRTEGKGYILIEGYHRLEALRALGEENIDAYIVKARLH